MNAVEIAHLGKTFSSGFSLENIQLTLRKGEIHVLVGENGSGKSALMKILSGFYSKDRGTIHYMGRNLEIKSYSEAKAAGIFYQHQEVELFENLTVAENIYFSTREHKKPFSWFFNLGSLNIKCHTLFSYLGIHSIHPNQRVASLGFGERQLIALVKAYVSGAKVLIFDEPTASMAEPERQIFFSMVMELKKHCLGIFYVSHRMDEISTLGDRVSVMHQGKILATSPVKNIDHAALINLMNGENHPERYPRLHLPSKEVILSVRNLSFTPVLKDVSFELRKGEVLGITGLMGSGRTCLANCLFGNQTPTGGALYLKGKKITLKHPADALGNGIALVPEDRVENALFPTLTLQDNVTIASLDRFYGNLGLEKTFMRLLVNEYVHRLAIKPGTPQDSLCGYSGGNQQKVMIARWFMRRAAIYILDEPTRGVDLKTRIDIYNAINDVISKGVSVILISSDIEEILGMCDRALVLSGGRIVADLPWESATKSEILDLATLED